MKPVDQTKFGEPDGNCFNACVASLLECAIDDLPDLSEIEKSGENWLIGLNDHLRTLGFGVASIEWGDEPPASFYLPQGCYYIASGTSRRGLLHSTIYKDGSLIHDPHPDRTGILKVESVELLVRIS